MQERVECLAPAFEDIEIERESVSLGQMRRGVRR